MFWPASIMFTNWLKVKIAWSVYRRSERDIPNSKQIKTVWTGDFWLKNLSLTFQNLGSHFWRKV